jgi:hypothetical protein
MAALESLWAWCWPVAREQAEIAPRIEELCLDFK